MDILKTLGVNATFFVQLINFLLLVFILYKILYKPFFKTIDARTDKIKKGLDLTEKMELEIKKMAETKQQVVKEAQEQANLIMANASKKAEENVQQMIAETRKKGEDMIKQYSEQLAVEKTKLEAELDAKVYSAVKVVLKKVMSDDKDLDRKFISSVISDGNGK